MIPLFIKFYFVSLQLNKFNPRGDMLASTMGLNILLWARREFVAEKQVALMTSMKRNDLDPRSGLGQSRERGQEGRKKDGQSKRVNKTNESKLKTTTQSQTKGRKW